MLSHIASIHLSMILNSKPQFVLPFYCELSRGYPNVIPILLAHTTWHTGQQEGALVLQIIVVSTSIISSIVIVILFLSVPLLLQNASENGLRFLDFIRKLQSAGHVVNQIYVDAHEY